jgi:hypothetical protein
VGHEDRRAGAAQPRGERQRLGVVARRGGADALQRPALCERRDGVEGAAELERARALQTLGLQRDTGAELRVERPRADDRRAVRDAVEAGGCAADVGDRR